MQIDEIIWQQQFVEKLAIKHGVEKSEGIMTDKNKKRDPMPPPDATPEEIGEFWDTHSLADYWDETHEVEFQVNLKSGQNLSPDVSGTTDQRDTLSEEEGWQKLKELIQSIKPKEFEKLAATLLTSFLEIPFDVAGSGDQPSGDAKSLTDEISVQTKRYTTTKLNLSLIEGEIHRVMRELTNLQFYVLAVSREIGSQQRKRFSDIQNETSVDIVVLELTDELSDLGALCVTFWQDVCEFFATSDTCQNQAFLDWIKERKDDSETEKKIKELRFKLEQGIQTQSQFQKDAEEHLLMCIGVKPNKNPRSNCSIDLSKITIHDLQTSGYHFGLNKIPMLMQKLSNLNLSITIPQIMKMHSLHRWRKLG